MQQWTTTHNVYIQVKLFVNRKQEYNSTRVQIAKSAEINIEGVM